MEIQIHEVQAKVLRELLFKPKLRFSELNVVGLSNDHFSFHLRQIVDIGLIEKTGNGYGLTIKGKEFANRMDTDTSKIERQAKTAVLVVATRRVNKKMEYLVHHRLKHPFYGFYGFITGKVRWGERILEAAKREFKEESGLSSGRFEMVGVEHKMDTKDGQVQEDKYFYIFRVENPKGDLVDFEGGENMWLAEPEIGKLPNKFDDISEILKLVKKSDMSGFIEREWTVGEY